MKEQIKEAIYNLDTEIENQLKICEDTISRLQTLKRVIRKLCDHSETQYYPDASGNNDSYHVCLICGLERKRFK